MCVWEEESVEHRESLGRNHNNGRIQTHFLPIFFFASRPITYHSSLTLSLPLPLFLFLPSSSHFREVNVLKERVLNKRENVSLAGGTRSERCMCGKRKALDIGRE